MERPDATDGPCEFGDLLARLPIRAHSTAEFSVDDLPAPESTIQAQEESQNPTPLQWGPINPVIEKMEEETQRIGKEMVGR